MATEFICLINKTGQDYDAINAWAAATAGDLTSAEMRVYKVASVTGTVADGDTVVGSANSYTATVKHVNTSTATTRMVLLVHDTVDERFVNDENLVVDGSNYITLSSDAGSTHDTSIVVAEIYDDDGDLPAENASIGDGITTDATNYRKITVPVGDRHSGKAGSGARFIGAGGADLFVVGEDFLIIEWLRFYASFDAGGLNRNGITLYGNGVVMRNCIVEGFENTNSGKVYQGIGLVDATSTVTQRALNCIVMDVTEGEGMAFGSGYGSGTHEAYNCTVYNCGNTVNNFGYGENQGTNKVINCLGINNGSSATDFDGGWNTMTTCGSSDTSGSTGLQNLVNTTEFVDPTGSPKDLHLKVGATSIDAGTDQTTTPAGVQFDIDNYDRDTSGVTWDVGADEYVAASSSSIKTINALAKASVKTINSLANASMKTWNGLA